MIFRGKKPVTAFLAVAALVTAFIASGCSGNNTSNTGWTLVGKVIDANSRLGVPGARVCVKINGDWNGHCSKSSTGASGGLTANTKPKYDATTTVGTTVGDFSIPGLPYLTLPTPVSVQAPVGSTYSDTVTTVNFAIFTGAGASAGNANGQYDMGQVAIDQGVTVNVFVITNTPAAPVNTNGAPIFFATGVTGDVQDVLATYVSGNQYTITLPRSGVGSPALCNGATNGITLGLACAGGNHPAFLFISPFKSASGAYFNGAAENVNWQDLAVEANPTINLTVAGTSMVTPLTTVATNFITMTDNSPTSLLFPFTTYGLAKDGVIKLYLNEPITLVTPTSSDTTPAVPNPYVISLSFVDYFKLLTAVPVTVVQAVTAAVDATDPALLTITPTAALTENQTYAFAGRVQAASDWAAQPGTNNISGIPLDTVPGAGPFYVYPAAATVAGSIGPVQMDNGNGWSAFASGVLGSSSAKIISTEGTTLASPGKPRLMFPEMVWGTIRLIDYPGAVFVFGQHAGTGTITYNAGNLNDTRYGWQVTGIGTSFTTQLQIGDQITDAAGVIWTVVSIDSDTSLWANTTGQSAVPSEGAPGLTYTVSLREGYYTLGTTNIANDTLIGTQRVPSTFVNDARAGDVLSIAGQPYTVSASTPSSANPGMGRELVVSLAATDAGTLAPLPTIVTNGTGLAGKGWLLGDLAPVTVFGSWGNNAHNALLAGAGNNLAPNTGGSFTALDGLLNVTSTANTPVSGVTGVTAVGLNTAGKGYTVNALSLSTSHQNSACTGTVTTAAATTTVGVVNTEYTFGGAAPALAQSLAGCKAGDLLAVYGSSITAPTTVGIIQITAASALGVPTKYVAVQAGVAYVAATAYNAVNLGSYLNEDHTSGSTQVGCFGSYADGGVSVLGALAACIAGGPVAAGHSLVPGINVETAVGTVAGNDATLGAAGSVVTSSCANTAVACFTSNGSAGAIAGDILTVWNPNVGKSTGAALSFPTAAHGTIQITAVDTSTGLVSAGVILSSGAAYPNAASVTRAVNPVTGTVTGLPAGVKTSFAKILSSQAMSFTAGGITFTTINAGSNPARTSNDASVAANFVTDLQKFGGAQQRALEDWVLAKGGNGNDIAALTYSVEYKKSCGNGTDAANTMGPQAAAEAPAQVAFIQSLTTGNLFNLGGFDAPSFFGSAAGGPALLCDLSDGNMFGWAGGTTPTSVLGATAAAPGGPLAGYTIQDSTSGVHMRIRLDVNVVDMAGNSLKALDTAYDVH